MARVTFERNLLIIKGLKMTQPSRAWKWLQQPPKASWITCGNSFSESISTKSIYTHSGTCQNITRWFGKSYIMTHLVSIGFKRVVSLEDEGKVRLSDRNRRSGSFHVGVKVSIPVGDEHSPGTHEVRIRSVHQIPIFLYFQIKIYKNHSHNSSHKQDMEQPNF